MALLVPNVALATGNPTGASLEFTAGANGDCKEITATVTNSGDGDMEEKLKYEVWYAESGNPKKGEKVDEGTLDPLSAGKDVELTYTPEKNGNYMFKVYQESTHPGTGEAWSEEIEVKDCSGEGEEPGDDQENDQVSGNDTEKCIEKIDDLTEADLHEITLTGKAEDDNVLITATLKDAQEAEGQWEFFVAKLNATDPLVHKTQSGQGVSQTFTVPLDAFKKAGDYAVVVLFTGNVDGEECQIGVGERYFTVNPEDTEKPIDEAKEQPKQPNNPDDVKKITDDIQGGKMPKTSINAPISMVVGGVMALAGLALLFIRRRQTMIG